MTMQYSPPGAFAHATVGVASLEAALSFWAGHLGFEIVARREGADAALAGLWNLSGIDIARQALVKTPTAAAGAIHLVEFARPAAPVRAGAQVFDHLPKNLDLYVRDIMTRFDDLKARGITFRSEPVTLPSPDGLTFREVHLAGHDDTNVVLLEIADTRYDTSFNARGFAGIGPLVTSVADLAAENIFFRDVLGMAVTFDFRLDGPELEKAIGLPSGAALLLKVYGDPDEPLGRIEVIEYERTHGRNLFPHARPPALGTLHVNYRVPQLGALIERLHRGGVAVTDHGERNLLYGTGRVVSFHSPAGFRLEVQEAPSS